MSLFSLQQWMKPSVEREHLVQCQKISLRPLVRHSDTKVPFGLSGVVSSVCRAHWLTAHQICVVSGCSLEMLDLLAEVFHFGDWLVANSRLTQSERKLFTVLDGKLRAIQQDACSVEEPERAHASDVAELFRLAALIYLHRMYERLSGNSEPVPCFAEDAFDILARLRTCERAFPLFIVGCEARTDARRALVLEVISDTEVDTRTRSYACIRWYVKLFWNLDDLD
jgi:hypothetical protein